MFGVKLVIEMVRETCSLRSVVPSPPLPSSGGAGVGGGGRGWVLRKPHAHQLKTHVADTTLFLPLDGGG
jgi:hypothetical protein